MSSSESPTPTRHPAADGPECAMCPHPWSAHDALGRRFCTATQVGVWSRGCICTSAQRR